MKLLAYGILMNFCIFLAGCMTEASRKTWEEASEVFGGGSSSDSNSEAAKAPADAAKTDKVAATTPAHPSTAAAPSKDTAKPVGP